MLNYSLYENTTKQILTAPHGGYIKGMFTKFLWHVQSMVFSGWYTFRANPNTQPLAINTGSRVILRLSIFWMENWLFECDIRLVNAMFIKSRVMYEVIMEKG